MGNTGGGLLPGAAALCQKPAGNTAGAWVGFGLKIAQRANQAESRCLLWAEVNAPPCFCCWRGDARYRR